MSLAVFSKARRPALRLSTCNTEWNNSLSQDERRPRIVASASASIAAGGKLSVAPSCLSATWAAAVRDGALPRAFQFEDL
jgi:hypothetical protein